MIPVVNDSAVPALQELADRLGGLFRDEPRKILYLSRNDLEPGRALQDRFPKAIVTIWSKADFQGLKAAQVLAKLRHERYGAFVLHDRPANVRRLRDLYRLIAFLVRAERRFLVTAEMHRGVLEGNWNVEEINPATHLPGLAGRLFVEAATTAFLLLYTPLALGTARRKDRIRFVAKDHYRIAYLRTEPSLDLKAGGSVSHISGVTGGMRAAGHDVFFISSDALPGMERTGSRVHVIPPGNAVRIFDEAAMIAYHHRFIREAGRILAREKPDLIYQRHSVFSAAGALLARSLRIPLVLEANHSEMHARIMWSRLQLRKLAEAMELSAFRGADVIVAVSEIGKSQLTRFGADPERILVNPNGVDPQVFHPEIDGSAVRRHYDFGPDHVVCGFLGTFTRWHGVLFLADAMRPLARTFPRLRALFMGDGDLRSLVEENIESSGLAGVCGFTGLIPHQDVPRHLAACDILIAAHLPFEDGTPFFGSPTKLFEYMAMGKSVVASNLGQIGEVIQDGESGLLFSPGSEPEFADRMSLVLSDEALRNRLGRAARRRVIESYTWEKNVNRVFSFLESRNLTEERLA